MFSAIDAARSVMRFLSPIVAALSPILFQFSIALPANLALAQQPSASVSVPRIDGFEVKPAQRLSAGNQLTFTLYGTPGGTASASISGIPARILLGEVEPGMYEGTYTLKSTDRIAATTPVTVNLRLGNQIASEIIDEPLLAGARLPARTSPASTSATAAPRIDSFELDPPPNLVPGEHLFFTLRGSPAGSASVRIPGVKGKLLLDEVQAGVYEGSYVIRQHDRIASGAKAAATLHLGNREVTANLRSPLLAGPAKNLSARRVAMACANCGVVEAINEVQVKGKGSYIGKIGGGVIGGLLGSEIGNNRNSTVTGIAGAVGGAILGNEIEKRVKKAKHYDVIVRLHDGGTQTVTYPTAPAFRVGDKVKVENGVLVEI